MNRKIVFPMCVLTLSSVLTIGCTTMPGRTKNTPKTSSDDAYATQTEEMRKTIDNVNPEKKKSKNNSFLYGGLSSEAREIEDHLYGN